MKYELIDPKDAPEDLSAMSSGTREKLLLLRALKAGKVAKVSVEPAAMRAFKAAVTRLAGTQGIAISSYSDRDYVYIRLADRSDTGS